MTPNLLDELEKIVALSEKATPGPWESASRGRYYVGQQEDEASVHGADDADIDEVSNVAPLHLADTIRGDCYKPDADLIAASVNFIRTHAPALADMAKRMEAAESLVAVARRVPSWTGEDVPEGCCSDAEFNDAIEAYDAAIDATKEGEG
ncbi:hypothetical protein ACFWZU_15435 [Frateuria sp. GZRR33]|uniref:hypothetical protein n=1 Tax=Frateuria sp. GZRR33 TaxID=3351535 RepID=UPI003EDBD821